jgi:hypothetical protein
VTERVRGARLRGALRELSGWSADAAGSILRSRWRLEAPTRRAFWLAGAVAIADARGVALALSVDGQQVVARLSESTVGGVTAECLGAARELTLLAELARGEALRGGSAGRPGRRRLPTAAPPQASGEESR